MEFALKKKEKRKKKIIQDVRLQFFLKTFRRKEGIFDQYDNQRKLKY